VMKSYVPQADVALLLERPAVKECCGAA